MYVDFEEYVFFNSHLSIGYHNFTWLFSTFTYYENLGVVLWVSK